MSERIADGWTVEELRAWRHDVATGDTLLGFGDWLRGKKAEQAWESEPYRIEDTCCGKCSGGTCYVDQITGA